MNERGRQESTPGERSSDRAPDRVRIHESRPGRLVFTEDGNTDGWIATDLVVDPER